MKHNDNSLKLDFSIPKHNFGIEGLSESKLTKELKEINHLLSSSFSVVRTKRFKSKYDGIGKIHTEIYHLFENLIEIIPTEINNCRGIPLVLYLNELDYIPEIILKKALVFGETTIIVLPSASKHNLNNSLFELYKLPTMLIDFFKKYQDYIEEGFLIPIPYSIYESLSDNFKTYETSAFTDNSIQKSITFSIKDKYDLLNITQTSHHQIFFPALTQPRLSSIKKLRIKEYSSFRTFHNNLQKLRKENSFSSERELIEVIKATDDEVRAINSRIKNIRKASTETLLTNTFVGIIGATLLTSHDNTFLKIAASLIGANSSTKFFQLFTEYRKEIRSIHSENFYFPWKLDKIKYYCK